MYDKKAFVDDVIKRGLSRREIVAEARIEIHHAGAGSERVRGAEGAAGSLEYAQFLKCLVLFLEDGERPATMSGDDFLDLRPLAQRLVDRGDLRPSVLRLFEPRRMGAR